LGNECGRGGLAAKLIPPRPGHAPALGLRAEDIGFLIVSQTASYKEQRHATSFLA
jgi:hypothetical protein